MKKILAAGLMCFCGVALAAPTITLREVASGFSAPLEAVPANDGSGRLFVVQQGGLIRILEPGSSTPGATFADLSASISSGGERGLLGLAFHPNYAANGAFYVYYTNPAGNLVVARMLRLGTSAADPTSRVELLEIPHPSQANHNGGKLVFGPDGYLYIGAGDGGGGGDPFHTGQNLNEGRGKILRIAVDGGTGYTIPPTNPFAASVCAPVTEFCREVFHYGVRNPWRFSFDRATGEFFLGDVGQGAFEEVDYLTAGHAGGVNFGWGIFEGNACFNDNYFGSPGACNGLANHTRPVITYAHDSAGGISISGGYVYRGKRSAALRGYYIYGDYGSRRIWGVKPNGTGTWTTAELIVPPSTLGNIPAFAQDERGELYAIDISNGKLWAIDGPAPAFDVRMDLNGDAKSDILMRNSATGDVYRMLMDGRSVRRGNFVYREPDLAWKIVAEGDLDGDGVSDLVWSHPPTSALFFQPFNAQGFSNGGKRVNNSFAGDSTYGPALDLAGNGRYELVRRTAAGDVSMIAWDGATLGARPVFYSEGNFAWTIVAAGDFAGTGRRNQILWRNSTTGEVYLQTVGAPALNGVSSASGAIIYREPNTAWKIVGAGDFDGDGKSDILWRNDSTGQVWMMLMNGEAIASQQQVYVEPNLAWKIVAVGDYDGDGKSDILWRNDATGELWMLQMNGFALASQGHVYTEPDTNWKIVP
jgi:glucose/arabinose dehydrogenase